MTRFASLARSFAAALLPALIFAVNPVEADSIVYVSPTSSIVSLSDTYIYPTSSIVSTSYLLPTTYVTPTSYVVPTTTVVRSSSYVVPTSTVVTGTSYLVPTSTVYLPRSYIRRTARYGTIVSPTYYVTPTTYLTPTYYLSPTRSIVETRYASAECCDYDPCCDASTAVKSVPAPAPAAKTNAGTGSAAGADRVERRPTGEFNEDTAATPTAAQKPKSLTSTPAGDNGSGVEPASNTPPTSQRSTSPPAATAPPETSPFLEREKPTPPPAAVPPPVNSTPAPKPAAPVAKPEPPAPKPEAPKAAQPKNLPAPPPGDADPGLDLPIPPPIGAPNSNRRDSLRPKMDENAGELRSRRNVLQGRVLSADTGDSEEGVVVVLTDRMQRFVDRTVKTDALGRFAVSLPDGDWTVKVTMPSGRTYVVGKGDVTATSGRITDADGREVSLLTIRR